MVARGPLVAQVFARLSAACYHAAAVLENDSNPQEKATVHGLVLGAPDVAPRQLQKAFDTVVRTRGGKPKEEADGPSDGIWVEARLYTFEVHGAWVAMETEHELPISLAHELAAKVNKAITAHVLTVYEEVVENAADEDAWGYRNEYRTIEVSPDGTMLERDSSVDPAFAAVAHGDVQETAHAILWMMLTEQDTYAPQSEPRQLAYILPSPRTSNLPPRLAELATLIEESGKFSVQQVGGQTMLRLTLPDGSRRFSRVTPEELDQLRETTGIEPS